MRRPIPVQSPGDAYDEAMRAVLQCGKDGDFEGARNHSLEALEIRSSDPDALWYKAASEIRLGRFGAAEDTAAALARSEPDRGRDAELLAQIERFRSQWQNHDYARLYDAERAVHMDFPRNIGLETVGRCNATCSFCPHGTLDRRFTEMTDTLFEKILADLSAIPAEIPTRIFPNLVDEPFMDKKIFDRLARINQVLPNTKILIFTNFNVLPKDFVEKLRAVRNLEQINVSFNAANRDEYEAVMGIDFDRTVGHLRELMRANRERPFLSQPVVLSRVSDITTRDQQYGQDCRKLFAEFQDGVDFLVNPKQRMDWLGAIDDQQSPIPYALPCGAWLDLNVMCTGVVPLCCIDAKGEHSIGDANTENLLEIYNKPVFRGLRERETTREDLDPCGDCALLQ